MIKEPHFSNREWGFKILRLDVSHQNTTRDLLKPSFLYNETK
jgi:hypothetical protein